MSLHAELSPEALERLHKQRRNSTISSIVIAALVITLICLVLGFFLLPALTKETPTIVTYQSNIDDSKELETKKVQTNVQRKPSSPSSSMAKVITAAAVSDVSIPVPEVDVPIPSMEFGDGDDFGSGWGNGDGEGGGFATIPPSMKKRCSREDRLARLQEMGGTPECEDAVLKALRWLKSTQASDGSWGGGSNNCAMTGLALLAYLGHCETPLSEEFGDSCLRAITYLVNVGMKNNGKLSTNPSNKSWPYEHGIATYALGEASTFCKQGNIPVPNLFETTTKAAQFIVDNQHKKSGGWDYSYAVDGDRGGDLSVAAWQIQALKASSHSGLDIKRLSNSMSKAAGYVDSLRCRDGGFGYSRANEHPHAEGYRTMTGGGVLSLQMLDKGSLSSARGGAKYIEDNGKFDYDTIYCDLYGAYYEVQAMMNRGGAQWKLYNKRFRDEILQNQNEDGSWKSPNNGKGQGVRAVAAAWMTNTHYRTCLCTLMLEVYYRFLPGTGAVK
ncbi:MAG: terpene cyclase/mutase family protein [Akkermansiaceae bacterium]|nr:terpene cyclase/mutase family protein [Akkermansiaceae bacterium]